MSLISKTTYSPETIFRAIGIVAGIYLAGCGVSICFGSFVWYYVDLSGPRVDIFVVGGGAMLILFGGGIIYGALRSSMANVIFKVILIFLVLLCSFLCFSPERNLVHRAVLIPYWQDACETDRHSGSCHYLGRLYERGERDLFSLYDEDASDRYKCRACKLHGFLSCNDIVSQDLTCDDYEELNLQCVDFTEDGGDCIDWYHIEE